MLNLLMIRELEGALTAKNDDSVILTIAGIGLRVFVPLPLLSTLPKVGEKVKLYTHLHVREDALTLYGFATPADRALFEDLLTVSNVGPKLALRVMSVAVDEIKRAILADDESLMPAIKGVGPRIRKAIVLALRDRIGATSDSAALNAIASSDPVLAALVQLGYTLDEARQALKQVPSSITETADRVKAALKLV